MQGRKSRAGAISGPFLPAPDIVFYSSSFRLSARFFSVEVLSWLR